MSGGSQQWRAECRRSLIGAHECAVPVTHCAPPCSHPPIPSIPAALPARSHTSSSCCCAAVAKGGRDARGCSHLFRHETAAPFLFFFFVSASDCACDCHRNKQRKLCCSSVPLYPRSSLSRSAGRTFPPVDHCEPPRDQPPLPPPPWPASPTWRRPTMTEMVIETYITRAQSCGVRLPSRGPPLCAAAVLAVRQRERRDPIHSAPFCVSALRLCCAQTCPQRTAPVAGARRSPAQRPRRE
jgi:hypothetical protein